MSARKRGNVVYSSPLTLVALENFIPRFLATIYYIHTYSFSIFFYPRLVILLPISCSFFNHVIVLLLPVNLIIYIPVIHSISHSWPHFLAYTIIIFGICTFLLFGFVCVVWMWMMKWWGYMHSLLIASYSLYSLSSFNWFIYLIFVWRLMMVWGKSSHVM